MLTTNLNYARAFFNRYLLGEACLHDDVNAKDTLNKILRKTTCTLTAYALALTDFADFVKKSGPFSSTPQ
jgi:hypothetical protein